MTASSCRVHMDWENFRHNIRLLQQKGRDLMPVIKADAYGHGVLRAAAELEDLGIDWAAIGTLEEGEAVRAHGYSGNLVALLAQIRGSGDIEKALASRLVPLVHDWRTLDLLRAFFAAHPGAGTLSIAVKVDSGMARLGFRPEEMGEVTEAIAAEPRIVPAVIISHLAAADEPEKDDFTAKQAAAFRAAADILRRRFPAVRCSLGNTAGLLCHTDDSGDLCRPGEALYGGNPLYGTSREAAGEGMRPVMAVSAPILSIHALHAGEKLGYSCAYVADSEHTVGWVAIGYADGYRRNPAPGTCMCVGGVRVPVIGRVAMQMTCVDLTGLTSLPVPGDEAFVLGGPGDAVTMQELADWWGTIPYEVLCLLGRNKA